MSIGEWLLVIFSGLFVLVMALTLVSFVVRLFRNRRPHRRKRSSKS